MGVEKRHSHVKFSRTIRLGKNIDLDNAVAGSLEVGSLRDTGVFIQRWNGTEWRNLASVAVVQEMSSSGDVNRTTTNVFTTETLTANLPDPSIEDRVVNIRSISGTTTITADAGTVENDELTTGQSTTLVSRSTGWFEV